MRWLGGSLRGGKMYNLLISSNEDDWSGEAFFLEISRCVCEHTEKIITEKYGKLPKSSIKEIMKFPCIFAYEKSCKKDPKFGYIKKITQRQDQVRIEYEIIDLEKFLSYTDIPDMLFELDINKFEMNRTHWAIKDVDLENELASIGILMPNFEKEEIVDITKHQFEVALSFPGEVRDYVGAVANELENILSSHSYFYDKNYTAQLARPSLDILLQDIYRNRSKLIVVFICEKYQEKEWPNIEFRSIKEIIMKRQHEKVMFIKMDDGKVDGVFDTDGYIDGREYNPHEIARYIKERRDLLLKQEME